MSKINYVDIGICIFILNHTILGGIHGLVKSLFISFSFAIRVFLTYLLYTFCSPFLLRQEGINKIVLEIKKLSLSALPNLQMMEVFLEKVIFIFLLYFLVSIVVLATFQALKLLTNKEALKMSDRILGLVYGFVKAVFFLMLLVYAVDTLLDPVLTQEVKEGLSSSRLLVPLYTYNIFLNIL